MLSIKALKIVASVAVATLSTGGAIGGIVANQTDDTPAYVAQPAFQQIDQQLPDPVPEPVVRVEEERKPVVTPFETTNTNDSSLAKGTTKVRTEGVNGEKIEIYKVTYTDDVETARELVRTEVVKEPVKKVIVNGTYVAPAKPAAPTGCTNGTYVNSAGNTVCSPSSSNTGGATAVCKDGTYSYSQSRKGTCSHHGGVSRWL
jgi:hypothetical protein